MNIFATNQHFDFGEVFIPNGGEYGPLLGEHLHALVLLEGHDFIVADDKRYEIKVGEAGVFYTEKSIKFYHARELPTHLIWCCSGEFIPPVEMADGFKKLQCSISNSDMIRNFISIGVNIARDPNPNISTQKDTLGQLVFDAIFYILNKENEEKNVPERVLLIKKKIENSYTEDININELANAVGWHPTYLLGVFKRHTGYTPTQYLWLLRAEKAIYLLNNTGLHVAEIAYQCNFKTPGHFTNYLKRHYRYTPTELRNNLRYRDVKVYLDRVEEIRY